MNRKIALAVTLLLIALLVFIGTRYAFAKLAQHKREVRYQAELGLFQKNVTPGMTREQVENYLRLNNRQFTQISGIASYSKTSWDDLVLIGKENAPWFCSANYVYIAFEFTDYPDPIRRLPGANDRDPLKSIRIFDQLSACL